MMRFLFLILLMLFFAACEFSPSEIPMSDIEQPTPEGKELLVKLSPEVDTLRLSVPTWVNYTLNSNKEDLYKIEFFLNAEQIGNVQYDSPTSLNAYLPTNKMENGLHELSIIAYTKTHSGSIADGIGAEAFMYELKWPVYVNKNAADEFKLEEVKPISEGVAVSWTPYNYVDFEAYELSWSMGNGLSGSEQITDPYQTSFIHESFVEGRYSNYSVMLRRKDFGFAVDDINYVEAIKKPMVKINTDFSVDVKWAASRLPQNIESYCIATKVPNYGISEEQDITSVADTTTRLEYKIGFAGDYEIQLRYIPKALDYPHIVMNTKGGLATFALGDSIASFEKLFKIKTSDKFVVYKNHHWLQYNNLSKDSLQGVQIKPPFDFREWSVAASPDGKYVGCFEDREYVVRRGSDLSVINRLSLDAYPVYNFNLLSLTISNSGLICVHDFDKNIRIYNIHNGEKEFDKTLNTNYGIHNIVISAKGDKMAIVLSNYDLNCHSITYYSIDGDHINEIGKVEEEYEKLHDIFTFSPEGDKLVYSRRNMHDYHLEIRDAETFTLLHKSPVLHSFVPIAFDFITNQAVAQYKSFPTKAYSYLIDVHTGTKQKVVQFTGRKPIFFNKGEVFAGNGRTIKIADYIIE